MVANERRIQEAGLGQMPERTVSRSYPAIAEALRERVMQIMEQWRAETMLEQPDLNRLSVKEFRDEIERILKVMADALESNDRSRWLGLAETAAIHGYDRFNLDYSLTDLMAEERTLRRVIVEQVEKHLDRALNSDEGVSLQTAIDFMLQQGVLAMAQEQKEALRAANESQVKYLSFFSHDLANNLMVIRLRLESVKKRLEASPDFKDCTEMLAAALDAIDHTAKGTRSMVEYQTLRKRRIRPALTRVNLRESVLVLVDVIESYANLRGVKFEVHVEPDVDIRTDPNLLALILQNLLNNAVKHARPEGGTVTIDATRPTSGRKSGWTISIADEGPGIPEETRKAIMDACEIGEGLGAPGLGLGMAIACQSAQLLKSHLEIESRPQGGTIFKFALPAMPADEVEENSS